MSPASENAIFLGEYSDADEDLIALRERIRIFTEWYGSHCSTEGFERPSGFMPCDEQQHSDPRDVGQCSGPVSGEPCSDICSKQTSTEPGSMLIDSNIPYEMNNPLYQASIHDNYMLLNETIIRQYWESASYQHLGHGLHQIPRTRAKGRRPYTVSRSRLSTSFRKRADMRPEYKQHISNLVALFGLHELIPGTRHLSSRLRSSASHTKFISLCSCLSLLPCVGAAPVSKGHAEDIQARVDDWWQILLLIAPYVIIVAGTGRAMWILRWPSREFEDPVYSGAFAFASAFTWWAVRSMEAEGHARTGPVILTAFLACWAIFMAESRRPIREKSQYLLTSVFSGCMVSLLITAMVFIPAFEATKKGKNAMAEYMEQTCNVGPIWLMICSFATYVWQRYRENPPASQISDPEEASMQDGEVISTSALERNAAQNLNGEEVHQRGARSAGEEPEQPA